MKDFVKKLFQSLLVGVLWVFVLSVPIRGKLIFDYLSESIVPFGLVSAIGKQAEATWKDFKTLARQALSDADAKKSSNF